MPPDDYSRTALIRHGTPSRPSTAARLAGATLPPDLLAESVRRLRAVALLYALAYFLAGYVPALTTARRAEFFAEPVHWLPGALSMAAALAVAGLTWHRGLADRTKLHLGLLFEIFGSFGIAAAEYHGISAPIMYGPMGPGGFGLSWVAAWVLLFTVVVPSPPRVALLAALASLLAVPFTYGFGIGSGANVPIEPLHFFFALVFPNLIVLMMAWVGAHVVYRLGTAVREAREMGSYRLVERLGEGGMGEVWRARHRLLARPAAIKLIRPEVLGARDEESRRVLLRRFEREAQATALMRSPHTMELYDFGVAEDGTFYYVMELLEGFDAETLIERYGPIPAERAVHLLAQMCDSLAEAHEASLIHRDIKPANVFVCRYGRAVDHVKVLDFGLVKHRREPEEGAEKLTADHTAGGTPAYMSPEQTLGDEQVDGRSDLYALGCVAYWLLTGTLVFRGRTPMETMVMHVQRQPERPSARTELPVPPALEEAILDCLAKDPADRPQTADELRARLAAVPCEPAWTADRARAWWDTHRPSAPASGVAAG